MAQIDRQQKREHVIEFLNRARALELNAIAQYMNHHYNLDAMDFGDMAKNVKLIAIDEMRHAEMFAERIGELGGEPTTQPQGKPATDGDPGFMFKSNAHLEDGAILSYNEFLLGCRQNGDSISAKLFEEILDDEQAHFNYFENIRRHISQLGETYLAQIAGTPSATGIQYQGFVERQGAGGGQGTDV
ncbi:MAG: bacterioferritin [Thermoleophilia bacterium]|nr:bacterioferritin [Thermoleophilia bacterium]